LEGGVFGEIKRKGVRLGRLLRREGIGKVKRDG
jgi:hypothetical protein